MVKKKSGKSKVKVDKLNVNKETVQDLNDDDMQKVQGGSIFPTCAGCGPTALCATNALLCYGGTVAGTPGCGGKTAGKKCNP